MDKKKYIILAIILIVFLGIMFIFSFIRELNTIYIVFPDSINLKYQNKWEIIKNEKLPNYKYDIIQNGNLIKTSKLRIEDDRISCGDINLVEDIIAIRGNKITNKTYQNQNLENDDYNYLNNILSENSINIDVRNLPYIYKYVIDLNNDGIMENIYSISNNYDFEIGPLFSAVIVNNKIIQLDQFSDEFTAYIPNIYFVDINKNNYIDMIIKNVYASLIGQKIKIINFNNELNYNIIYEEDVK